VSSTRIAPSDRGGAHPGNTTRRGGITKHGNRQARWALAMAASSVLLSKGDSALQQWGRQLAARVGRQKACCAIARRLAALLWAMRTNETAFDTRLPAWDSAHYPLCDGPLFEPFNVVQCVPHLSRSTDRGRNLDCTHSSSSILCPGNIGPTKSTYRWLSRGSSKGIHGAPIPLFSPTKRVSVHGGSCSIDNSRSIQGEVVQKKKKKRQAAWSCLPLLTLMGPASQVDGRPEAPV